MSSKRSPSHYILLLTLVFAPTMMRAQVEAPTQELRDTQLQRAFKKIEEGTFRTKKLVPLIKRVIQILPEKEVVPAVEYIIQSLKKRKKKVSLSMKHRVMSYALSYGSLPLVQYLLKKKFYDKRFLNEEVRYDITLHKSFWEVLVGDILQETILPHFLSLGFTLIKWLIRIHSLIGLFKGENSLLAVLFPVGGSKFQLICSLVPWIEYLLNGISLFFYMIHGAGIKKQYLILLLQSERSNEEKSKFAQLLLAHGASPTARCIDVRIEKMALPPKMAKNNMEPLEGKIYQVISPMTLAVGQGNLALVKELKKRGASLEQFSYTMKDKVGGKVSVKKIYWQIGRKQSLLDLCPDKDNPIHQYLKKKGIKRYRPDKLSILLKWLL